MDVELVNNRRWSQTRTPHPLPEPAPATSPFKLNLQRLNDLLQQVVIFPDSLGLNY